MFISVVIPVLNEERLLPDTLAHTLACGFDELIVVDGGSTDRTREIVQTFQLSTQHAVSTRITLLAAPPGRASQMNAGASAAVGDVLLFLHADTRLPTNARTLITAALQGSDCIGGRFDVRFDPDSGWGRLISCMMNVRSRWTGIATGDQTVFVKRASFQHLGGFSEIPIMEDIEFSRRMKRAGKIAALGTPVVTSYRRWQTHGPFRTILLMWALRTLYWLGISPRTLSHLYGDAR
ncbi:MAG TPA: TIGR04283 family arsenosugar biosynthesis glycosyltransferase [Nitrospiraceae bacterium]|nr:TIGR04283 family arsenosugar biosynthesis glycosyltransferase [Nitrospiraceae bacterium]